MALNEEQPWKNVQSYIFNTFFIWIYHFHMIIKICWAQPMWKHNR